MRDLKIPFITANLVGATALLITGCSSSGNSSKGEQSTPTNLEIIAEGPIDQAGTFSIDRTNNNSDHDEYWISIEADFSQFNRDISQLISDVFWSGNDTCEIDTSDIDAQQQPSEINVAISNSESISAGDTLIVSSSAGTYTTLLSQVAEDEIFYKPEINPLDVPSGLTLDVPGDAFPAFTTIAIPDISEVEAFDYPVNDLTESVLFTWTASNDPNTRIRLGIGIGQFSGSQMFIDCEIKDDGSFELPAEIVAVTGNFSDGYVYSAERIATNLFRSDRSVIGLTNAITINVPSRTIGSPMR